MGFFKRNKERLEMAKTVVKMRNDYAHQPPVTGAQYEQQMEATVERAEAGVAHREHVMRLNQAGVQMPATVRAAETGPSGVTVDWTVEPPGASPYETRSVEPLNPLMTPGLVPGAKCNVLVDPEAPASVMAVGLTPPGADQIGRLLSGAPGAIQAPVPAGIAGAADAQAPAGPGGVAERLEKLAAMHDAKLITDAEFAERKAQIIGS